MAISLVKTEGKLSATLLVVGCCIGAGMIGLPVMSALAGFIPTTLAMVLCYFFAVGTGLLIVEATLWFEERVNLISMAGFALGRAGKAITWALFLFLFYCIFVAYIDGGGQIFSNLLSPLFHYPVPRPVGILTCVGFVGVITYAGTQAVSYVTKAFLLCLAASYFALVSLALPKVNVEHLLYMDNKAVLATIPILLICFGYQNLLPTLTYFVKRNVSTLRFAIFVGNLIPFLIYFLWNYVILGILPKTSPYVLKKIVSHTDMVTGLLETATSSQGVLFFVKVFSFFGILTPFIANTIAFVDFIKDGLKTTKVANFKFLVYALVLIPPTLLTLTYPHLFLKALGIAGGFADVLLLGVLPALIVWIGRYRLKMEGPYRVPGGKLYLVVILLLCAGILLIKT